MSILCLFWLHRRLLGSSLIRQQTSPSEMKAWWYPAGYCIIPTPYIRPRALSSIFDLWMSNEHAIRWWWRQTHGKCIHDSGISLHADLTYCHPNTAPTHTPGHHNITTRILVDNCQHTQFAFVIIAIFSNKRGKRSGYHTIARIEYINGRAQRLV